MEQTIKIASLGPTEELRQMNVGDVVHFPIDKYNYNTIRATPSTSLIPERMNGWKWKTKIDIDNKIIEVKRIA